MLTRLIRQSAFLSITNNTTVPTRSCPGRGGLSVPSSSFNVRSGPTRDYGLIVPFQSAGDHAPTGCAQRIAERGERIGLPELTARNLYNTSNCDGQKPCPVSPVRDVDAARSRSSSRSDTNQMILGSCTDCLRQALRPAGWSGWQDSNRGLLLPNQLQPVAQCSFSSPRRAVHLG